MNVGAVGAGGSRRADLQRVAGGFESLFLRLLMKSMRRTVVSSSLFSGGQGEAIFTQLMDSAVSDLAVARGRGIGVADLILERYGRAPGAVGDGTVRYNPRQRCCFTA